MRTSPTPASRLPRPAETTTARTLIHQPSIQMTTIPRNHTKRVAAVFDSVTTCHVHRLDNNFATQPCEPRYAREALHTNHNARLIDRGGGKYTVSVHGNLWYELTTTPPAG